MNAELRRRAAFAALSSFYDQECSMIERNLAGLRDLLKKHPTRCEGHALRAEASYIHDFYNSAENLFRAIAEQLNGGIPRGDSWHKLLLVEMKNAIPGERPAAISTDLYVLLEDCLKFRHLVRNSYGVLLDPRKTRAVSRIALRAEVKLRREMKEFLKVLSIGKTK